MLNKMLTILVTPLKWVGLDFPHSFVIKGLYLFWMKKPWLIQNIEVMEFLQV